MYKFVQSYTSAYTACVHATSYIWSSAIYSHVTQYQVLHMMDTQTWALTYSLLETAPWLHIWWTDLEHVRK